MIDIDTGEYAFPNGSMTRSGINVRTIFPTGY